MLFFYARHRYGLSSVQLMLILAGSALLNITVAMLGARLARRFGERRIVVVGLFLASIGIVVMGLANTVPLFLAGFAFFPWVSACMPAFMSILSKSLAPTVRAEVLSGIQGFQFLSSLAAVLAFPAIFNWSTSDSFHPHMPGLAYLLAGGLMMCLAVFLFFFFRRNPDDRIRVTDAFIVRGPDGSNAAEPTPTPVNGDRGADVFRIAEDTSLLSPREESALIGDDERQE